MNPMLRRVALSAALALPFVALGWGVRQIPAPQCGVLHAGNLRDTGGALEFCGPGSVAFVDLLDTRPGVRVEAEAAAPARAGEPTTLRLRLATSAGRPLFAPELAVVHTRPLHLLVTDPTLADYQHLHPEPAEDGWWTVAFTPRLPGEYRLVAEVVPLAAPNPVLARAALGVAGPAARRGVAPLAEALGTGVPEGLAVSLETFPREPRAGEEAEVVVAVRRTGGDAGPIRLGQVMGAWAHLVAFDHAGRGVAHLHPRDEGEQPDPVAPSFGFGFLTERAGTYRFWAQLELEGRECFVPFDVQVAASASVQP